MVTDIDGEAEGLLSAAPEGARINLRFTQRSRAGLMSSAASRLGWGMVREACSSVWKASSELSAGLLELKANGFFCRMYSRVTDVGWA